MTTFNPTRCPGAGDRVTWPYDPADADDERSFAEQWEAMTREQQWEALRDWPRLQVMELIDDLIGWD